MLVPILCIAKPVVADNKLGKYCKVRNVCLAIFETVNILSVVTVCSNILSQDRANVVGLNPVCLDLL